MKKLITNYTFNKTAKTVTFTDYTSINLEGVLVITNVTDNIIIYNFADPLLGGSVLNNVLTLTYNTSSMSNTDDLQIWYDDTSINASTSELQSILNSTVTTNDKTHLLLQEIRDVISMRPDYVEATNTQAISGTVAIAGMTGTNTITTLTNQTNIGGYSADMITENGSFQDWGISIRSLYI